MNRSENRSTTQRFRTCWIAIGLAGTMVLLSGCPGTDPGVTNDNQPPANDNAPAGNPVSKIVNISTSFPLSEIAPPVAIEYVVADELAADPAVEVRGFYRQVADDSPNADQIGAEDVILTTGLPAVGGSLFFSFDPGLTGPGFFRVGIVVISGGTETTLLSAGTIQVQGPPNPLFRLPVDDVTEIIVGDSVRILFDAQDPEGDVRWRLFYLSETERITKDSTSADQLGTEISTGSSNVGEAFLSTTRLETGSYEIGVSAVDSGDSITRAVIEGRQDQIVTVFGKIITVVDPPPAPLAPTLVFSSPSASGEILLRPEFFSIDFAATVDPSATASATIELFWDENTSASDGVTTIVDGLPITDTTFEYSLATICDDGAEQVELFIGGSVVNVTPPLTTYASGSIIVICEVTLDVISPDTSLPFEPGQLVSIEWATNAPLESGTVDVFAFEIDADGQREGLEIPIIIGDPFTRTTASFTSNNPGRFEISVRLKLEDGTEVEDSAPQTIQFSSLPGVLWLGSLAETFPRFRGAIFEGVNFEDNAGASFASAGDVNGDGFDDFVVAARYGKSFFDGGGGVGPGEAYLVCGQSSEHAGTKNLNSVGTQGIPGVVFVGIRTPQGNDNTDGLTAITQVPDVDGDGRNELMFGFPSTDSRGHNVSIFQDGVRDPTTLCTLEKQQQFLRGGVVIVSSQNSALRGVGDDPVINLDLVGQDFDVTRPQPESGQPLTEWFDDRFSFDEVLGCIGSCGGPASGDTSFDSASGITMGFNDVLADDYITVMVNNGCAEADWYPLECMTDPCAGRVIVEPTSPILSSGAGMSGFYPTTYDRGFGFEFNPPREPFGARIVGIGLGDRFGTSVTLSNATGQGTGDIIITSPGRTARGILLGPDDGDPTRGGEVDGLEQPPGTPQTLTNAGVAYLFQLSDLWSLLPLPIGGITVTPPKPHQYMIGQPSHTLGAENPFISPMNRVPNIDALRIAGDSGDEIRNIVGIDDFNGDGLNDIAVAAPEANDRRGRVYIAFRRLAGVEGDFVLNKLDLDPDDTNRLAGVLITSGTTASLGASIATGVDFNGDGAMDLVIGSPNANAGRGEIIVVFGDPNLTSPFGGISIQTLLTSRDAQGRPRAARITGNALDINGKFGFNIANAGDINGDGFDDLLVAAPNATPRFDPEPNDAFDLLTEPGIDANLDGIQDDVSGQFGVPDLVIDSNDDLVGAGVVYVISGTNRFDRFVPLADASVSISINQLGTNELAGYLLVGRRAGDQLGGGDAGDVTLGGISEKAGRGRSLGLAAAGDVNGDGMDDFLIGSVLADPRIDPNTGDGTRNAGEAYLIYGSPIP